ncbi:MAG: lipopolysaccharide kinase InaA family protein [Planctomycetota bacterium]
MAYDLAGERYRGRFAEAVERDQARAWLAEAHGWFERRTPLPTASWKKGVALFPTPLGDGVIKRVAPRRRAFERRRRTLRLFELALRLGAAGVETAQPWAAFLPRRGDDPAILLAELVDVPTLWQWIRVGGPGDRAAVATALADTLVRLHRGRLRHRDLKSANVLLDPTPPQRVVVLDLDGARARDEERRPFPARTRARDLARLRLSLQLAPRPELFDDVWPPLLARYAAALGDDPERLDAPARRWAERHAAQAQKRGKPIV